MAPILIDRRHLLTAVVLFLLIVTSCLITGYVLGYQAATQSNLEMKSISELQIPDPKPSESSVSSEKVGATLEPGEDIDVDSPDFEIADVADVTDVVDVTDVKDVIVDVSTDENNNASDEAGMQENDGVPNDSANENLLIVDTADASDARYTIQVGLYGNKRNADRKVAELLDKNLSAYISDSVNRKDETLFNVRFGYFNDKQSVVTALELYQEKHTGDGYIVRLRQR